MPRENLQDGADEVADEADGNGLFAPKLVAEFESDNRTEEGTELRVAKL
jgi:hypothetical protein